MSSPLLFDIADTILTIMTAQPKPEALPPPMTREQVLAQPLYPADCMTTRDGLVMTCNAAFRQDLKRSDLVEERKQK